MLAVLTQLTGFHLTRGMRCALRRPALPEVAVLCANAARVAVLENVMNPTNIGAIFRSAAALGMDAVLLTAAGSDPLYRRSSRVSMGNVFLVPWTYLPEDADWTALLHQYGFKTAAMEPSHDGALFPIREVWCPHVEVQAVIIHGKTAARFPPLPIGKIALGLR